MEVSVIIPNFNGIAFLDSVLGSLEGQTLKNFEVILVDNGSADGSCSFVSANYPWVHIIELPDNFGFCRAVNEGIKAAKAPYVLLLNNDTEVKEDFVEQMLLAIRRHKNAFSCAARMVQYHDRDKLDDAGNYYCALGWSFARGKGKNIDLYQKEEKIFSACGGAAIYRKKIMEKIGYFDEEHFAYLEDTDIGYRARIYGYENWYVPDAVVYLPLEELIDFEQEMERLRKEESRLTKEIARSNGMLNNEKFVSKAPAAKVQEEKDKLEKYQQMMDQVKERLEGLKAKMS